MEFYRGQVNRDDIIQTLLEITPKVYGSDNRKKSVYQALRRVLLTMEGQRLINVCIELLQLEFSCVVMENLFDICNKYDGQEKFIVYINFIIAKREFLSLEEPHPASETIHAAARTIPVNFFIFIFHFSQNKIHILCIIIHFINI